MTRALFVALSCLSWAATSAHAQQPQARPASERAARLLAAGETFLAAGDRGSAIGYFRDAIAADPFTARAYEQLGEAYRARGSLPEARQVYELGVLRVPAHAPLWLGLARTLDALGAEREAAEAVRALLERTPHDSEGLAMRADLARRRGAWSEALTATRTLLGVPSRDALDAETRVDARRRELALRLLARPLDPVSAPRACQGSEVRRALARCPRR